MSTAFDETCKVQEINLFSSQLDGEFDRKKLRVKGMEEELEMRLMSLP